MSVWALAGGMIVVGVALKLGTAFLGRELDRAPIVAAAPSLPVTNLAPAVVSNDVELILTADAPIESVRTGGSARRIAFENGRAHVFMAPWSGPRKRFPPALPLQDARKTSKTIPTGARVETSLASNLRR